MNPRTRAAAAVLTLVVAAAAGTLISRLRNDVAGHPTVSSIQTIASPPPASTAPAPRRTGPSARPVDLAADHFIAYSLTLGGVLAASGTNEETQDSDTASLIKAWLAADVLTRHGDDRRAVANAERMVRDSDNQAASVAWVRLGRKASIARLVTRCSLQNTSAGSGWSTTLMSADDVARLGDCIRDGRAAGSWTATLQGWMRGVRGVGRFGIVTVYPDAAIKNGWVTRDDGLYHVACLAFGEDWSLGVLTRYPAELGLSHGAAVCTAIAQQLRVEPAPVSPNGEPSTTR